MGETSKFSCVLFFLANFPLFLYNRDMLFTQTSPTKTNKKRLKNRDPELGVIARITGIILIPLASFPIFSIISYDYRDIPSLYDAGQNTIHNFVGMTGALGTFFGYSIFGLGLWLLPIWMLLFGFFLVLEKMRHPWRKLFWAILFQVCISSLFEAAGCHAIVKHLNIRSAGGALGWFLMTHLTPFLGRLGSAEVIFLIMIACAIFGIGWHNWISFFRTISDWHERRRIAHAQGKERARLEELQRYRSEERQRKEEEREQRRVEKEEERARREEEREQRRVEKEEKAKAREEERLRKEREYEEQKARLKRERELAEADRRAEEEQQLEKEKQEQPPPPPQKNNAPVEESLALQPEEKPYVLPSINLLSAIPVSNADCGNTEETSRLLSETMAEFNVPGTITHVEEGPVITTYEFQPAPRIRPEQVASMDKTLEMRIRAKSLRIEAPIPGKGVCGIEVPNKVARSVTVREILEGETWKAASKKQRLPLILGKDASGHDLVADLAQMPHLLVAGATGSGKSVCMNAMLTGLLMSRTPEELKLILVDPKVVEFAGYNAIPHLVVPVITEPKKVSLGLIWAIHEMEKRYKMLSTVGVKNIESFNNRKKIAVQQDMFADQEEFAPPPSKDSLYPDKLPYIVIVIDEMADLMLQVKKEIEDGITRLAQKSRAVGIHLILATQRPTVNIVTGTIKANIAGRIAFQVAQKNDSKVILDRMGADTLIGKGDMLFLNPRTGTTIRAQGAYISDTDAESVTEYIRSQAKPKYSQEAQDQLAASTEQSPGTSKSKRSSNTTPITPISEPQSDAADGESSGDEKLFEEAIAVIKRTRRASTSSLQRALGIGYNRAARIFDLLEERGIVGPSRGALPREILIDLDGEIPTNSPSNPSEITLDEDPDINLPTDEIESIDKDPIDEE